MKVRAHITVRGRVQGVFFRASMREIALANGVTGWVRNLADGRSVEAVLEGDWDSVEKVLCWSLRGPPGARVEEVEIKFEKYKGEFKTFEIRF
ncbi:MAG: acylphosphatase [Desulfurococcales archaeon]|nr:acylphosphatase [Desulfurococcales archaeon]